MNKILALDASTKSTGYAIFSNKGKLFHYDCLTASSNDLINRIKKIVNEIDVILTRENIEEIIMEEVRPEYGKNMKTYKALNWLHAALAFLVHDRYKNISIQYIYPSSWRKNCGIKIGPGIKRETLKAETVKFINMTN